MIQEWFEKNYMIYALLGLCGIGILIKLMTNFVYIRLVKASGNMSASKNKLIKQMKLKFETFYKLKIGVNNVDIFVDKYVYKYKICGLLLSTWENISGLMLILCLLTAPIFSILGLILDCGENSILYTFFTGVCTSATLILVDNLFNISSKRQIIKLNIKDYLENYLKARLEQEAANPEAFAQYRTEMASSKEKELSPRALRREEKRLEKERKEREKFLELEAKQKEREQRKQEKVESRQLEAARKEEEKRLAEEERRMQIEEKEEKKRRLAEEKREKEYRKQVEKEREAEKARVEAEARAARKRQLNAKKVEVKEGQKESIKVQEEQHKQEVNLQAAQMVRQVNQSMNATAAAKEEKKKENSKQTKIQQRNERLKEEILAQREQRNKERMQGKDPFETYKGTKKVDHPKNYNVNDFNMEYEMRVKAVQREEAKLREVNSDVETTTAGQAVAATVQTAVKPELKLRGNNASEDKVIGDILKEFLA